MLIEDLTANRVAFADAVIERLGPRCAASSSTLLIRSLMCALAQSIDAQTPDAVVSWARLAIIAHSPSVIDEMLVAACDVATEHAETLNLDLSALLVLFETVKSNVSATFPIAPAFRRDDQIRATTTLVDSFLAVLRARDEATAAHSHATGAWCRRLCEFMQVSPGDAERIVKAGMLHDIGMVATPDAILFKPSALTPGETLMMQQHADIGADMLLDFPGLSGCAPIVRAHHEHWDGSGYPRGLRGRQIPFEARMIAVADSFHAMISHRPYRAPVAQRDALGLLRAGRGAHWDGEIVDALIKMLEAPRPVEGRGALARV